MDTHRNCAGFYLVIDPNIFGNGDAYYDTIDQMVDEMHALKPAVGVEKVLIPGEIEQNNEDKAKKEGFPVYENVYNFLTS